MVSMHTSPADRPGTGDAGGMNVYVLETAKALAARGHDVDVFTRAPGAPATTRLHPGVTLFALATRGGIVRKHELAHLTDEFGEELLRIATASHRPYDVLHAHYWLSGLASLPVALALGTPMLQSFHTLGVERNRRLAEGESPEPDRRQLTERYLVQECDAVVSVSSSEADTVIDELGAGVDKVWLVQPGVDSEVFAPAPLETRDDVRARLGVADHEALVVVVGRVQPAKGQELAVRMLEELPDTILVVVGEPPPGDRAYADGLHAVAREIGVAERVRFIGSLERPGLAKLLGAASLVVVPSRTESFGIVPLEAAACGTPVVAARVGGLGESVIEGVSGVLVDGREPAAWAAACRSLLDDPVRLAEMSASARASVADRSWAARALALERVYLAVRR